MQEIIYTGFFDLNFAGMILGQSTEGGGAVSVKPKFQGVAPLRSAQRSVSGLSAGSPGPHTLIGL